LALNFGHSSRWTDVTISELKYFAARAGLPERLVLASARDVIQRFHEVWTREKEHLPLTRHVRDVIEQHLKTIPLIDQIGGT
jgi:serine/threonine-protein kinase HipA